MSVTTNPIPVKSAMAMLGHDVGGLRLPLVEASASRRRPRFAAPWSATACSRAV